MSSSNQQASGDPRSQGDRTGENGYSAPTGDPRRDGPQSRGDVASRAPHDSRTMTVPANPYQPHGQPTGRWEYVPGSAEDAQGQLQAAKSTDASLILGILSVTVLPLLAPFAVWQASKAEKFGGRATVGKVLGWVGVALLILGVLWFVFIIAIWGFAISELQQEMGSSTV